MVTIDRDYQHGRGTLFTIKLSEPGMGVRAMVLRRATLRDAQMAIAHYYAPGDASHDATCLICTTLADTRAKQARKDARTARKDSACR